MFTVFWIPHAMQWNVQVCLQNSSDFRNFYSGNNLNFIYYFVPIIGLSNLWFLLELILVIGVFSEIFHYIFKYKSLESNMILLKKFDTLFIVSVSSIIFNVGFISFILTNYILIEQILECNLKKQVFQCIFLNNLMKSVFSFIIFI